MLYEVITDKDEASKISDEFLAKAISQWIYWSEKKDMAGVITSYSIHYTKLYDNSQQRLLWSDFSWTSFVFDMAFYHNSLWWKI